ncbi:MAG: hypothetical protein J6S76_00225 [Clostridia bacterium]|nr:hypothetical protein [Clostridia bacterium]
MNYDPYSRSTTGASAGEMIYEPVPRPQSQLRLDAPMPTPEIPAILSYIIRTHETAPDGTQSHIMYFYIGRDRSIPLTSFVISYRFSALPVMIDDPEHPFYCYTYTDDDINDHDYLLCKFTLPPSMAANFPGCSAFVSEINRASSTAPLTFTPGDFVYSADDAARVQGAMNAVWGEETFDSTADASAYPHDRASASLHDEEEDALEIMRQAQYSQHNERRRWIRILGYALLAAGSVLMITAGATYLSFQSAMLRATGYVDSGDQIGAEQYLTEKLGKSNPFFNSHRESLSYTIRKLCREERYNEAYRIISDTPFASMLEDVCREASDRALERGDWETAYLYALGAPTPFDDEITSAAIDVLLDPYAGSLDEDAYRVAQKSGDTARLDDVLAAFVRTACSENRYHAAMRAAQRISDETISATTVADVFSIATRYYFSHNNMEGAAAFIGAYRTAESTVDEDIKDALIVYFSQSTDADSAFFLAKQFGIDASHIQIAPEDSAIRADIAGLYPLLTAEQKRSYHASSITCGGLLLYLDKNGSVTLGNHPSGASPTTGDPSMKEAQARLTALLKGKPAVVSLASGPHMTAFLHANGTVTLVPNSIIGNKKAPDNADEAALSEAAQALTDVVAVTAGDAHFAFLHDDGTVSCLGSNASGQCETDTFAWEGIAAIAAGADFTVGLKMDGTVVVCGSDKAGQASVSDLHNVIDIDACAQTTVVLFSDGSIGLRGEHSMGIAEAIWLENVVRIRAGGSAIIAQLRDNTYTLCGGCAETGNYGSVASWKSLTDYAIGSVCAASLDSSGVVRTTGTNRAKQ